MPTWALITLGVLALVIVVVYYDRNARGLVIEIFEKVGLPSDFLYG